MAAMVAIGVGLSGCGSKGANVVTVSVGCSPTRVLVSQTSTCSATVSGSSNTSVTWSCTYTTTSAGTTSQPVACTSATGNIPANSSDTTVVFTAPQRLVPNPLPTITITATSQADQKRTGTATLSLDSGIRISVSPSGATVPTKARKTFTAGITVPDPSVPVDVTWLVTQQSASSTTPLPQATSCAPGCGNIDGSGVYTAPDDVPSTPTVTVVVSANSDPSMFASATVTVVAGGPITFNGISPAVFAQGAFQQDIYLDAPNVSSISSVVVKRPDATIDTFDEARFKTVFSVPNSAPASQTSIGARIRLSAADLKLAGTYQLCIKDEAWPVTPPDCPLSFPSSFVARAMRPSINGTIPVTVTDSDSSATLTVNGGYFGAPDSSLVTVSFDGAGPTSASPNSSARQLSLTAQTVNSNPGLYRLSVAGPTGAAVSNVSVFPDYRAQNGTDPPMMILPPTSAGSVPSAVAIDTVLGIAVVAQAGANTVQFYTIGLGTLTPLGGAIAVGHTPTSVAINEAMHQAVVVNYGDKSLSVLQIPSGTVVRTIGLGLGGAVSASPNSVGVDPDTNRAMVALSSTNIGLIVNLNASGSDTCIDSSQTLPCATASVTLNTGQYPQIAMEPGTHRAWVTPGGVTPGSGGPLSVVDLRQTNGTVAITNATRASNVITVNTSAQHSLDPGNPGVVLITGMSDASFNGSFAVLSVVDAFHFTYSSVGTAATATGGMVRFGKPNLAFNLSTSTRGIALNTITRTAATADPIASGSFTAQIDLINSLDQSISTISLAPGCYGTNSCAGPETDTTHVAFQPYSNVLVSFNPVRNEASFLNPDPGTSTVGRQFVLPTGQTGVGSAGGLTISGAVAVDPATNQALVVNSGSGNITLVNLSTRKKNVQITRLVIPGGLLPQATLTSSQPLNGVQIFGSDFTNTPPGPQVELDGTAIPASFVSSREVDVNIPASFLSVPRRFALDVLSGGVRSNATDFIVLKAVDFSPGCGSPSPAGVVIDDARDIAVVTDSGCNTVSIVDANPDPSHAATYGTIIGTVGVGAAPTGVAVVPRYGFAVVANNGAGTASVLDLRDPANPKQAVPDVTVGTSPNGVAINPENGEAIIANTGSNNISEIDLSQLLGSSPATSLTATSVPVDQQPIAVAIDPDRGTSGRGLAVVTAQQIGVSGATASLDVLDLGTSTPTRSTSAGTSLLTNTPTGIAFDATSGLFYVTSSSANAIISFNPDTSRTSSTSVGINPTAVAFNPQTGAILTVNSASNTISVVDTLSTPFRTRATLGISGSGQYGAAIHGRTNMGFIADPANKRVLLFPMP